MTGSLIDTTQRIQLAVKAAPSRVWDALVDGAVTPAYYLGFRAEYPDLSPGADYRYTAGGGIMIVGRILEVEPGRLLRVTFNGRWDGPTAQLPESVVTFRLFEPFMPMAGVTFLSCEHQGLPAGPAADHLAVGWVAILSGLKTLLETGEPMAAPAH